MKQSEHPKQQPTAEYLFQEIEKYRQELATNKEILDGKISDLKIFNDPVIIEKHFFGIVLQPESVANAITKVSINTHSHLQAYYNTFTAAFKHFSEIFDLISMLSTIESDLYSLLDDNSSKNLDKFNELFNSSDTYNEEISSQIRSIINRTKILRDRFNSLKESIEGLSSNVSNKIMCIDNALIQVNTNIQSIESHLAALSHKNSSSIQQLEEALEKQNKHNKFNFIMAYSIVGISTMLAILALIL